MRRIVYILAVIIFMALPVVSRANVGMVQGIVRDAKSQKPIASAQVELKMGKAGSLTTKTDPNGQYTFTTVPAGDGYKIIVKKENYEIWKGKCPEVLSGKTTKKDVNLALAAKSGAIKGTIVAGGKPLNGVVVVLGKNKTRSGKDGVYTLDLPPGEYDLIAKKDGYKKHQAKVTIEPETTVTLDIELVHK